eukprot:CAMPEP_0170062684 /NCGR_PEP_ID=MMETSP0019_2-20121128/3819_1 /TAXON_ID=98059 /ORGANISM="Dinobryon sp., Strain UTEXLB2267" /LENGTH=134 /DNA_ID=CAMNT_0010268895 /DNA_START=49 /DNA_END=453 /DNA_ORIENTATION=+
MPASGKMLKSREQAANRAAGIGDENGRLPARVKAAEVLARCTICSHEIRMTKKNVEAKSHFESKHPTSTFAICFPGQVDPTVPGFNPEGTTAAKPSGTTSTASTAPVAAPKKKVDDLSFLDSALDSKNYAGKKK